MHPHLWGERRWEDGGIQEDPAVLRRHLPSQRAGADRQGPPAAVQPCAGGERAMSTCTDEVMGCKNGYSFQQEGGAVLMNVA